MSNIVLPNLDVWARDHLTEILDTRSQNDFNAAIDVFLAKDCTFVLNGDGINRDQFKQELLKQGEGGGVDDASPVVKFKESVEFTESEDTTGAVGLFFIVTISSKSGGSHPNKIKSSMNLTVEQDQSLKKHTRHDVHGFSDIRRVKALNLVSKTIVAPVNAEAHA